MISARRRSGPVSTLRTLRVLAASLALCAGTFGAIAQEAAAPVNKDSEFLRDYIHYVRIARYDLAQSNAQALLDRLVPPYGAGDAEKGGLTLDQFVKLVDSGDLPRFEESVTRGMRVTEIEPASAKLLAAYEQGKRDQARVADSITKNIQLLIGTSRQRLVGRERLMAAGEYALPQLLQTLTRNADPALSAEVRALLVDMGKQSVMPLAAALPSLDARMQETVAGILGDIHYKAALPFLYDLALDSKSQPNVRRAAEAAIARIDSGFDKGMTPSILFEQLGEQYYTQQESLISFPREQMQLGWQFAPEFGLSSVPMRSEVFTQTMAMRMAERALKLDRSSRDATALWVAANFKREMATPKDYKNPIYGAYRDAMYYAVTAGPAVDERVLARALRTRDTALALKAIEAISRTTGAAAITAEGSAKPLLDALRYPSRRVQTEAALALALAQPQGSFEGSDRVVPTLASAVRDAGTRYAAVVSGNGEIANMISGNLRRAGFTVLPTGSSLQAIAEPIASSPGVDLIFISLPGSLTAQAINEALASTRLAATPIVAIVSEVSEPDLRVAFGRNPQVALVREGSSAEQMTEATRQLLASGAGAPLSAEESTAYQTRALTALRDLAVSRSTVFTVADATQPLANAIEPAKGTLRDQIAEVLSWIDAKRAQVALGDAVLAADGEEQLTLMGKLIASAKRFGNQLDDRQLRRITDMAGKGSDQQATAVAALIGALNLPNDSVLPMLREAEAMPASPAAPAPAAPAPAVTPAKPAAAPAAESSK
ncbi:hypothetical protein BH11PLA1_BH11PLA1_05170 [soil metagenome]